MSVKSFALWILLGYLTIIDCQTTQGHCIWYGQCGSKNNCVYNGPPKVLNDSKARRTISDLCPDLKGILDTPGLCCDAGQINTFATQVQQAKFLIGTCPSCYRNFAQLFCYSTCYPSQSNFLSVNKVSGNAVDAITYYLTNQFAGGMYNSCAGMKLAMTLLCGGANPCTPQKLLNSLASNSPFTLKFELHDTNVTVGNATFEPMNGRTIPCDQPTPEGQGACACSKCPANCGTKTTTSPPQMSAISDFSTTVASSIMDRALTMPAGSGHCIWYGKCWDDGDGRYEACQYSGTAKPVTDGPSQDIVRKLCPNLAEMLDSGLCCDSDLLQGFSAQIGAAKILLGKCSSCFRNFAQLLCYTMCHPQQSTFLRVDKTTPVNSTTNKIDEITAFVSHEYSYNMFASCQNLTGNPLNQLCGFQSPCTPQTMFDFMGNVENFSPFQINFQIQAVSIVPQNGDNYVPMNPRVVPCNEPTPEGGDVCQCKDCPMACGVTSATSTPATAAVNTDTTTAPPFINGTCVWYDECWTDPDSGKRENCYDNNAPRRWNDTDAEAMLFDLCSNFKACLVSEPDRGACGRQPCDNFVTEHNAMNDTGLCCSPKQIRTFYAQMDQARAILARCPSCFVNVAQLFCQSTCSPKQAEFLHVDTKIPLDNSTKYRVHEVSYYVRDIFADDMFTSCQNVQFGTTGTTVMTIFCGAVPISSCKPIDMLNFVGSLENNPFQINFFIENQDIVHNRNGTFVPANPSIMPCAATCSCTDCPAACNQTNGTTATSTMFAEVSTISSHTTSQPKNSAAFHWSFLTTGVTCITVISLVSTMC